ncbi:integrator complex subunit 9 [Heterostelium album PN500]|uniref:Integrator complex subunit 9 n=1 Tax=Heterostelium pallidum (strain ATCC 26659 / Pp 5 / PN500) TaxID=670386 RepID=D3B631_HETP5|nr:integrator complex subunit 9 [Heterostelium album PN500]EFA83329.1 integrator complex subunit 9 [Heterostelium album PN500]|eukprot:XP_020435446.1 integrator complex subunit 9 [Heterostelium album PN500]
MKLHSLGNPCYLLDFNNTRILLDCAIDFTSILQFLPITPIINYRATSSTSTSSSTTTTQNNNNVDNSLKNSSCFKSINNYIFIDSGIKYQIPQLDLVDFETIDIILISNYTNIYALPFITEYTSFKGKIYATEPTLQYGRLLLDELVQIDKQSKTTRNQYWQSIDLLKQIGAAQSNNVFKYAYYWRDLYNHHDTEKCFEKIQTVRFNEYLKFYGFTIRAVSSGYCLGGSNWIVENNYEKIVYLSDSSNYNTRYPEPFDRQSLRNADLVIATKLNVYPQITLNDAIAELFSNIGSTLSSGGNVLIPTYSCGTILDLLEPLSEYLSKVGLGFVHIYFISQIAKAVLSYADIYSEWLNRAKKERSYMPEAPFLHQDMIRNQHFTPVTHITSRFQPKEGSIVFVGHPSCRVGDVVHMINIWGDNPKNSILLIEPEYDFKKTLQPFNQQLQCRIQFIPIDSRFSTNEMNDLIMEISPSTLITSYQYTNIIKNKQSSGSEGNTTYMNPNDIVKIKQSSKKRYENGHLDKTLAQQIQPKLLVDNGENSVSVAQIEAVLSLSDHKYHLTNPNISDLSSLSHWKEKYLWGSLSIQNIIKQIYQKGYNNIQTEIEDNNNKIGNNSMATLKIYHMVGTNQVETIMRISITEATIETSCEKTRKILMDIVSDCCFIKL